MPIAMSPTQQKVAPTLNGKKVPRTIGQVSVAPGEDAKLNVGTFQESEEQPSFILTYPAGTSATIKASLVRLASQKGSYELVYFFQSFGKMNANILVQQLQP